MFKSTKGKMSGTLLTAFTFVREKLEKLKIKIKCAKKKSRKSRKIGQQVLG